jgi:hypothetical protein
MACTVLAGTAAAAFAAASDHVIFKDNFSRKSSLWRTGNFSYGSITYKAGRLDLSVKHHGYIWVIWHKAMLKGGTRRMTVSADVQHVDGTVHNNMIVLCAPSTNGNDGYFGFAIGSNGLYGAGFFQGEGNVVFGKVHHNTKVIHSTAVNHVKGTCEFKGNNVWMILTVNGTKLLSARDSDYPFSRFYTAGFRAWGAGTQAFDNLVVTN